MVLRVGELASQQPARLVAAGVQRRLEAPGEEDGERCHAEMIPASRRSSTSSTSFRIRRSRYCSDVTLARNGAAERVLDHQARAPASARCRSSAAYSGASTPPNCARRSENGEDEHAPADVGARRSRSAGRCRRSARTAACVSDQPRPIAPEHPDALQHQRRAPPGSTTRIHTHTQTAQEGRHRSPRPSHDQQPRAAAGRRPAPPRPPRRTRSGEQPRRSTSDGGRQADQPPPLAARRRPRLARGPAAGPTAAARGDVHAPSR